MVADVEQMFHQVSVNPEHRDALRLHQMTVHIFGAKSSPCCANFCFARDKLPWNLAISKNH